MTKAVHTPKAVQRVAGRQAVFEKHGNALEYTHQKLAVEQTAAVGGAASGCRPVLPIPARTAAVV